MHGSGNVKRF